MNNQPLRTITLLAADIELNSVSISGTSLSLPVDNYSEWYIIDGNATLTSSLTIQSSGSPNIQTIYKFLYKATMTLSGNSITVFGYTVPSNLASGNFLLIAHYNGASWDLHIMQYNDDALPSGTIVGTSDSQTLTNKTLTTPLIDDTDAGCTLTSADQTHASATTTIPDIVGAADEFVMKALAQTLTNKTLTSPTLATPLIDDTDAGCTVTSADQTNAGATVTIPDIGIAADEFAMKALAQTFTNKSIDATANTITNISPDEVTDTMKYDVITAIVDLTTTHTVNILVPFKCEVATDTNFLKGVTTIAVSVSTASVMIKDHGGNPMFAADMDFAVAAAGDEVTTTVTQNNAIGKGENIKIEITAAATTGMVVLSIPIIRVV